ncbi:MGMT family protein [Desulfoplanes formicivorans]|uniref:DNA methyltransferase n=1 Tax=Desulfoplanes formicivorans TaxID=1592317 RepID=A0A194AIC0_9BACT|nr:MGMT family protein [Desulfoplanes formicivorans]GAU08504.1 DNA methyltransferase [Desulfoplanes formicivorans]
MTKHPFTAKAIQCIRAIPPGKVATYGQIATMAGNPRGARQVARILHACSQREQLPWHRVVNREGRIALGRFQGKKDQQRFLEREGVVFDPTGRIDLKRFLWRPEQPFHHGCEPA